MQSTIGIMQGRLSPRSPYGPQAFPADWRTEFALARDLGFDSIEWIAEAGSLEANPLMLAEGREHIRQTATASDIQVASVCAHCVLQWRPYDEGGQARMAQFAGVIEASAAIGAQRIVVPILEEATIAKSASVTEAAEVFRVSMHTAAKAGIELAFELDRPAAECREFLRELDSPKAKICYDSGNATALGFDLADEIGVLLPNVSEIHLKDRRVGGASRPLGQGDTRFADFFQVLHLRRWRGPFVLETPVLDDPTGEAWRNLAMIRKFLP